MEDLAEKINPKAQESTEEESAAYMGSARIREEAIEADLAANMDLAEEAAQEAREAQAGQEARVDQEDRVDQDDREDQDDRADREDQGARKDLADREDQEDRAAREGTGPEDDLKEGFIPINWASPINVYLWSIVSLAFGILAILMVSDYTIDIPFKLKMFLFIICLPLALGAYYLYRRQAKIYQLFAYESKGEPKDSWQEAVLAHLTSQIPAEALVPGDQVLELGSSYGALAINLSLEYPECEITSLDNTKVDSNYDPRLAPHNARYLGQETGLHFLEADFAEYAKSHEGEFAGLLANLALYRLPVKTIAQRYDALEEYLQILQPGGFFLIQDLWGDERYWGQRTTLDAFCRQLEADGFTDLALVDAAHDPALGLPPLLQQDGVLGKMRILKGRKGFGPVSAPQERMEP